MIKVVRYGRCLLSILFGSLKAAVHIQRYGRAGAVTKVDSLGCDQGAPVMGKAPKKSVTCD